MLWFQWRLVRLFRWSLDVLSLPWETICGFPKILTLWESLIIRHNSWFEVTFPNLDSVFICGIKVDKLNLMDKMLLFMHEMRGEEIYSYSDPSLIYQLRMEIHAFLILCIILILLDGQMHTRGWEIILGLNSQLHV